MITFNNALFIGYLFGVVSYIIKPMLYSTSIVFPTENPQFSLLANSTSLLPSHTQYSNLNNLYLLKSNPKKFSILINENDAIPNYVNKLHRVFETKYMKHYPFNQSETFTPFDNNNSHNFITIIMIHDFSLTHYYHFIEHLLGIYTIYYKHYQAKIPIKYVIYKESKRYRLKEDQCYGNNNIAFKLWHLLSPNITIICGRNAFEQFIKTKDIYDKNIQLKNVIISWQPDHTEINWDKTTSYCKWWGNMFSCYIQIFKPYMKLFRQHIWNQLLLTLSDTDKLLIEQYKQNSLSKYKMLIISREYSDRKVFDEERENLITNMKQDKIFGNTTLWEIEVVAFETLDFEQQIIKVATANMIIGAHGNGLTHLIYLGVLFDNNNENNIRMIVELIPNNYLRINTYMSLAEISGINYRFQWNCYDGWIVPASAKSYDFINGDCIYPAVFDSKTSMSGISIPKIENIYELIDMCSLVWSYAEKNESIPDSVNRCDDINRDKAPQWLFNNVGPH